MVNWGSREVGEDNHSESPGVMRRGAMAPHGPGNRVYLFPVTSGVLHPERIWYTLPNWQWVVPTRHLILRGSIMFTTIIIIILFPLFLVLLLVAFLSSAVTRF